MVTLLGFTFGVPDTVMGLTLVAFGSSVPDCLSSLFVAKKGKEHMKRQVSETCCSLMPQGQTPRVHQGKTSSRGQKFVPETCFTNSN